MREGDDLEPDFEPGEQVESATGFFKGRAEVVRKLHTVRYGWFVEVVHIGDGGERDGEVRTLCTPRNLKRVERMKD